MQLDRRGKVSLLDRLVNAASGLSTNRENLLQSDESQVGGYIAYRYFHFIHDSLH
jgi:hypothetical protein